MNKHLNPTIARKILETISNSGTPPEYGFQFFSVGLETYLDVIKEEYLDDFVKDGGSTFKLIVEEYGGGKTHFLYSIREMAWEEDYVCSYIVLSPERTPFHKMEAVYSAIVENLVYQQDPAALLEDYERGIKSVIEKWYREKLEEFSAVLDQRETLEALEDYVKELGQYDFTSYRNALKHAFLSLVNNNHDEYEVIVQWLNGEKVPAAAVKKFGIFDKIDKTTAFKAIRSLVQWTKEIGYSGLVILLDEAETSISGKQKTLLYQNLRELIDECGRINFKSTMWFYAVPDEKFLDGREQVYEALKQRLSTIFDSDINPSGVKIRLDTSDEEQLDHLMMIGRKLSDIYVTAYKHEFENGALEQTIELVAQYAYDNKLMTGYKRMFVQNIVKAFHFLKKKGSVPTLVELGL